METKDVLIGTGLVLGGIFLGIIVGGKAVGCAVCKDPTKCTDLLIHCK